MKPSISFRAKRITGILSLFLILSVFSPGQLSAQLNVHAAPADKSSAASLSKWFNRYSLFRVSTTLINDYTKSNNSSWIDIEFNFDGYPKLPVSIYDNHLLSPTYRAYSGTEKGSIPMPERDFSTFAGLIKDDPQGLTRLTLSGNVIYGFFRKDSKTYMIEPVRYFDKNADASLHVMYEIGDIVQNSGLSCGVTEAREHAFTQSREGDNISSANCVKAQVAIACDYSMVTNYGAVEAEQHAIAVMNIVAGLYGAGSFNPPLDFEVVGQYIAASPAGDPYQPAYTGIDANILLSRFTTWGQAGHFGFTYDLAQVWTAKNIGTETSPGSGVYSYSTIGLAWVSAACGTNRYALLEDYSTNMVALGVLTAHELGHNLGASHDPSGSFIMAPSVSDPPGTAFSSSSIAAINSFIPTVSCLGPCTADAPIAVFTASANAICVGSSITYTNYSQGAGTPSWTFTGGNISSSTVNAPVVTYTTTGVKSTTLNFGSSQVTKTYNVLTAPVPAARTSTTGNNTFPVLHGFHLGSINHPGPNSILVGGSYTDNSCTENTQLLPSTTYTATFDVGVFSGMVYSTRLYVFIDYNGDGNFLLGNESIFASTDCYFQEIGTFGQFSFTTPANPAFGKFLRLRLVALNCNQPPTNGHSIPANAMIEDYAVWFATPPSFNVTVTAGAGGSISPGSGSVSAGSNNTYTITPDPCYHISSVFVDGVLQGSTNSVSFNNISTNHTISATFAINQYNVAVTAGTGGSISPGTGQVACGTSPVYIISPDPCYRIADVTVDGVSRGPVGSVTLNNVNTGYTINATFVPLTYNVSITTGGNGTIQGPATVNCGSNNLYNILANSCYHIVDVAVDGVSQGPVSSVNFDDVHSDHSITATFAPDTYVISVSAGTGGTISPATSPVNCGSNNVYSITPDPCYQLTDVIVDGISQGPISPVILNNVTGAHSITAIFARASLNVTATAGPHGSIQGLPVVECGTNSTYTITADPCYHIVDVLLDGVAQGAVTTISLNNVTVDHTISASFAINTYPITLDAGVGGAINPAASSVDCGSDQVYSIVPAECSQIADVLIDGISQGPVSSVALNNVTAAHTITATFTTGNFSISLSAGANGSIQGTEVAACGSNNTYLVIPEACYHIVDVLIDGISQGPVSSVSLNNINANHTISASFALTGPLSVEVSGPVNVCGFVGTGIPVTYTATATGAGSYTWLLPPNVNIISGTGTANLTVTFGSGFSSQANKQVKVTALSACGSSPQKIFYLAAQLPSTPQPIIASSSSICSVIGTSNTISYSIPKMAAASSYAWVAPAGTTITHPNGPGINDTTVLLSFDNSFTNSILSVAAVNTCGTSSTRSIALARSLPATPGLISGPTNACAYMLPGGTVASYTVAPSANASSYTWTVPSGVTDLSGQGTNSITFTYPAGFTGGTVTVTAINGCGNSSTRTLAISKLNPGTPSPADVIQVAACPDRIYTYTLAAMPANTSSLQWTVPAGATSFSGQGTTSISVGYPSTSVNGNITVKAINNCASSATRVIPVKLPSCQLDVIEKDSRSGLLTIGNLDLDVKVSPNPTSDIFNVKINSATRFPVIISIMDYSGRRLETLQLQPNTTTAIGSRLKAGMYMLEARQGGVVKVIKILKS